MKKLSRTYLLNEVKKLIRAEPRRMVMTTVLRNSYGRLEGNPPCGTVGCIAGWTCVVAQRERNRRRDMNMKAAVRATHDSCKDLLGEATTLLKLDDQQASELFYLINWPAELSAAYDNAKTAKGRARCVLRRIDLFLRSQGTK